MTTEVFQRGETVPVWAENTKWDGTMVNPSQGIKITIRDPDGVLAKYVDNSDIEDKAMGKDTPPVDGEYVFFYSSEAPTTLQSDVTASDLSVTVATGEGDSLPESDFYIEIDHEIIKCNRTDDVLTVVRGQKGTAAEAHSAGAKVHRRRGWWTFFCKAVDGSGDTARTTITEGGFTLR